MRRFLVLVVYMVMLFGPALAHARSESRALAYPRDSLWPTAVRFLAVDLGAKIVEKDIDAGYLLFELKDEGKTYRGSLELVTLRSDTQTSVRFVMNLVDRPSWMEVGFLTRLEAKVKAELGSPTPPKPPPPPPKKDDDKKDDKKDEKPPSIDRVP